jgi:hypothetical protein
MAHDSPFEPAGPHDDAGSNAVALLLAVIGDLHRRAGSPSSRALAKKIGQRRISHSTVNNAQKSVVKWAKLELIVTALGGEPDEIRPLWQAAWAQRHPARPTVLAAAPAATATPIVEPPALAHLPTVSRPVAEAALIDLDIDLLAARLRVYFDEQPIAYEGRTLPLPPAAENRAAVTLPGDPAADPTAVPLPSAPRPRVPAPTGDTTIRTAVPTPAAVSAHDTRGMSAAQMVGYIMTYQPNIARAWGWL